MEVDDHFFDAYVKLLNLLFKKQGISNGGEKIDAQSKFKKIQEKLEKNSKMEGSSIKIEKSQRMVDFYK